MGVWRLRLASAKIAADRSISGDHGRWPAVPTVPLLHQQRCGRTLKSSASLSKDSRTPIASHSGSSSRGFSLKRLSILLSVLEISSCYWGQARDPLSRSMPAARMHRHEHVGLVGSGGSCAALLLTLISAAQCRRLRAVRGCINIISLPTGSGTPFTRLPRAVIPETIKNNSMVPCGSGATRHRPPGMMTRERAQHENRACFKRQAPRYRNAKCAPEECSPGCLSEFTTAAGLEKGPGRTMEKYLDVNISVGLGHSFGMCLPVQ